VSDDAPASTPLANVEGTIRRARGGSDSALGQLLEAYRPYLLLVANRELSPDLRVKVGASDLVQETFLDAQHDFPRFRGSTERELLAWLRRILLTNLALASRQFRDTEKRQVDREISLATAPAELLDGLTGDGESPSSIARAREQDEALERALAKLPEQYREVIRLRNSERRSFEEIGTNMGRSAEAARKLWGRALKHLQQLLESPDGS
jgi:RNA polymerase sigma-70 factor (ECF subfamily)